MTCVYITVDTEYSSSLANRPGPVDRAENFARSIAGMTPEGPRGLPHKLALLEKYGQRAVFFVDPMPALVWGTAAIEDVVGPILEAGQDVQLHCHTEWLAHAGAGTPFPGLKGRNIKDFPFEEQCRILDWARETLIAAGAPKPTAFRAGNYGANRDTLRALSELDIKFDTSFTPAIAKGHCEIPLSEEATQPLLMEGVIEVPVGCMRDATGRLRHAQITALSLREMTLSLIHARDTGLPGFTFVSHSFELVNRRRLSVNRLVRNRFEGLCRALGNLHGVRSATYRDDPPLRLFDRDNMPPPPVSGAFTTGMRYAEQAVSNALYGA
jgi:peptidoglycan/xylan/chitin deacetylase (PgdA/CDA1 family)